ncbi:hypothetical protein SAMN04489712_104238 [Thermomonospora echinospora]|uniref:DUF4232 domain-containing protein n=1 Tax=Thermomonospora echinospora TaxID=1992 RepID=A0A1H5YWU0_9ACTN|nr:hypothetical protein [Thermomonospora echinospora]SEG28783.1 hypothetical protein SAMN04489712_104238 [Thermomonospora echinospora]
MDSVTESDYEEPPYWRRRALVLAGLLAVVGLLVWTCGGGDDRRSGVAGAAGTPSPSSSPEPSGRIPVAAPTVTVTATAKTAATPTPTAKTTTKAPAKAQTGAAPRKDIPKDKDACERGDVVAGFSMDGDDYARGTLPQFRVSVVNTGERTCAFRTDPRALRILITSGQDRIWSSDHCVRGAGAPVRLRRGVPQVRTVTWDRRRSAEGCPRLRPAARPGTYVAELRGDGVKTRRLVFRLR